jgi:uncharacterized protein YkwD
MIWTHRLALPVALLGLSGCSLFFPPDPDPDPDPEETPVPTPAPTAIDEACADIVDPGDPTATAGEIEGLVRLNCYRRLVGLDEIRMDPALNDASRSHSAYQDAVGMLTHEEADTTQADYTGQWGSDRATAAGYVYDAADTYIQEVVAVRSSGANAALAVDVWIETVYHRVPLLRPQVDAVGLGQAGQFDSMLLASPWEAGTLLSAVYPADGQFGVSTSFDSDTEWPDPAPTRGVVGQPISIQFQGPWTGPFEDPFLLTIDTAATALTGPDGPVPCDLLTPSNDTELRGSAFLLPHEPLAPDADYTARFVGEVNGTAFDETVGFSTAAE